jgi:hypothetical protein
MSGSTPPYFTRPQCALTLKDDVPITASKLANGQNAETMAGESRRRGQGDTLARTERLHGRPLERMREARRQHFTGRLHFHYRRLISFTARVLPRVRLAQPGSGPPDALSV